jgi:hypothetical protein
VLQLRRDLLPALSFHHSGPPENPALPDSVVSAEISGPRRFTAKFHGLQKPATSRLNELQVGMKKSGMADEMCLMARCTIAGHIIRKSPYGSRSQPLKGVYDFYR